MSSYESLFGGSSDGANGSGSNSKKSTALKLGGAARKAVIPDQLIQSCAPSASWTRPTQPAKSAAITGQQPSSQLPLRKALPVGATLVKEVVLPAGSGEAADTVATDTSTSTAKPAADITRDIALLASTTKKSKLGDKKGAAKDAQTFEGEYDVLKPNDYEAWKKHRSQIKMQRMQSKPPRRRGRASGSEGSDTGSDSSDRSPDRRRRHQRRRRRYRSDDSQSSAEEDSLRRRRRTPSPPQEEQDDDTDGEPMEPMDETLLPPILCAIVSGELDPAALTLVDLRALMRPNPRPLGAETQTKYTGKTSSSPPSSSSAAVIVAGPSITAPPSSSTANAGTGSRVVLLTNMVAPADVDDALRTETADECRKYGKVVSCVVHQLQHRPDDQAVRIFVEFDSEAAAQRARTDLHGRYFAGRKVSAQRYDHTSFKRGIYTL
ncbi:hypothetical protein RI367_003510 [Sorochytrium milnesiophthora]